jgi:hypothetical protein
MVSVFAPEPVVAMRIAAAAEALDALAPADGVVSLRLAPDDLLLLAAVAPDVADPDAIVVPDAGWAGAWLDSGEAADLLARHADWPLPASGLAQGAAAGVPVKVLVRADRTLLLVPAAFAVELAERLA